MAIKSEEEFVTTLRGNGYTLLLLATKMRAVIVNIKRTT
jgi:hypothetical protein